jgi:hypothetical protein
VRGPQSAFDILYKSTVEHNIAEIYGDCNQQFRIPHVFPTFSINPNTFPTLTTTFPPPLLATLKVKVQAINLQELGRVGMKSNRIFQSLVIGTTLVGIIFWQLSSFGHQPVQASAGTDYDAAKRQPAAIQDPIILQGLESLRSHTNPIRLPNGDTTSGAALAQFIVNSHIPVVWGSDEICGGSSCSRMYCSVDGKCSYEDGQPGIDPIYLNPAIKAQSVGTIERLASELAHEAFHRMRYFGSIKISQFEEYWAFYVGAQLVKANWPVFDGTNPQDPQQLEKWFTLHGMQGYLRLPAYPGSTAQASPAQVSQALFTEPSE